MSSANGRSSLADRASAVFGEVSAYIKDGGRLAIIKAPPGSGKTYTLLHLVDEAFEAGQRVAIGTQTNAQADDICRRLARDHASLPVYRFASGSFDPVGSPVPVIYKGRDLPHRAVAVATIAKWGLSDAGDPFDILLVDEAWQMAWADFMLCGNVAGRFALIGDPGQIPPVVTIPVNRWETSPRAPHIPTPDVIRSDPSIEYLAGDLPASRRLPADAVELIQPFYNFPFDAWAHPGDRYVAARRARDGGDPLDPAIDLLQAGSVATVALRTGEDGPPYQQDGDLARLAAHAAARLLDRTAEAASDDDGSPRRLTPEDIGVSATHRVMNGAVERALPAKLRNRVRVDTPERWQGLERKVMIVVHPLSSVVHPTGFDLETGRLCVMASRHRSGLLVVSRDHVPDTLEAHIPAAEQAVGRPDVTGQGHQRHEGFWGTLADDGRVLHVA